MRKTGPFPDALTAGAVLPFPAFVPVLAVTMLAGLACANGGATIGVVAVPPVGAPVSYGRDVQAIFDARGCTTAGCHAAPVFAPMSLEAGSSYGNLVNVAACEAPGLKRVDPGHSATSYLIAKLDGSIALLQSNGGCATGCTSGGVAYTGPNSCGGTMPLGAPAPLAEPEIQAIRDWIDQGAQNN